MATYIYMEDSYMKRYKVGDFVHWYNEGDQPNDAILLDKLSKTIEEKEKEKVVEKKAATPRNKAKGVNAK